MKTFKERFQFALKRKDLSKAEFARLLKANNQNLTHWITRGGISKSQLFKACNILDVYPEWLNEGTGESPDESFIREPSPDNYMRTHNNIIIPRHTEVFGSMGDGLTLPDNSGEIAQISVSKEWATNNIPSNSGAQNLRLVTGFGKSMKGLFNNGDPLLIDIGVRSVEGEGVYFFRIGNEGYIKTLQNIPGKGLRAISNNKEYRDWTITGDMEFEVLGRVLKAWQSQDL